jgi:hypothetical protein
MQLVVRRQRRHAVAVISRVDGHVARGRDHEPLEQEILRGQLARLGSFERSGDLIAVAGFRDARQLNFEQQAGGHGSIGGEQLHPFLLSRSELGLDASGVRDAAELHAVLSDLRDRLGCLDH